MLYLKRSNRLLPSFRGMEIWLLVTAYMVLSVITAQKSEKLTQDPCAVKQTCHECIQSPTCTWCYQPDYKGKTRCFQPNINTDLLIHCTDIYNPDNEFKSILQKQLQKASPMSSSSSSSVHHEAVQISPQHVSLKLRRNEAYYITVAYAQAEDYPVDLYYLMDLSMSMEDDKDKLSSLGDELARRMQNITSNFRLGFGSFVDKPILPYISIAPEKPKQQCDNCIATYGFRNHMQLSPDTKNFSLKVQEAAISRNVDTPEGGFDAIMQAVVCREQIGWRAKARRLLVFSTDASFHCAGDGKLGGIMKPNDGLCHLDVNGEYTHSILQDYPSIPQLKFKIKKNAINIIFAVTAAQISIYENLSKFIEGSTSGTLTSDSSNIVDLVQEHYDKISSSVVMKDNASSSVQVTYYSKCLNEKGPLIQTHKCDGLKVGTKVEFRIEVIVKSCPENPTEWKQTFHIYPVGINESLVVDLEMLCDCPCEHPGHPSYIEMAKECSGSGTYKCGICECDHSHSGHKCECEKNSTKHIEDEDISAGCRPDNDMLTVCSGRGTCTCGQCECERRATPEERISGPFCECDNFSCDRHNGLLCAGPEHGTCVCGKCVCNTGWTGSSCNCQANRDTCIPPGGGEICSGHGDCECGVCKCHTAGSDSYSGHYCDRCVTCHGKCEELKYCVQCQVYKTGPLTEQECTTNCTFALTAEDVVQDTEKNEETLCSFYDEDDCIFAYVYSYDEQGKIVVRAQQERECPVQVYILDIVLGVIGAILVIGLALLLLWKLLTTIHDRREFAKFENERQKAKWVASENPLYKNATSTFKNPVYTGEG